MIKGAEIELGIESEMYECYVIEIGTRGLLL